MGEKPHDEARQRARLRQALEAQGDDACDACLAQLDDYVHAQLAGDDYVAQWPTVALHLDGCLACAGAYARLYEMQWAEAHGQLPVLARLPAPDLSFLTPEAEQGEGLATRLRGALRRVGDTLTLRLSDELAALLRPAPTLAPATRAADESRYGEVLLLLAPAQVPDVDLPLTLTAYRDAQQPEHSLVEVVVQPPGRFWPDLGGSAVTLRTPSQQAATLTDNWGLASFENVPVEELPALTLDVEIA